MKFLLSIFISLTCLQVIVSQTQYANNNVDYYSDLVNENNESQSRRDFYWKGATGYTSLPFLTISAISWCQVLTNTGSDPDPIYLGTALVIGFTSCIFGSMGIILYKIVVASMERLNLEHSNWALNSTEDSVGLIFNF